VVIRARLGFPLCAWALAPALAAQEPGPKPVHYGVRILSALPSQDFKQITGRAGLGAGVFAEADGPPGTVLQTRLDYISYPQTNQPGNPGSSSYIPPNSLTLSANSLACGFDVRYYLPYPALGRVFLLGGVSAIRYEFQTSSAGVLMDQNGIPFNGIVRSKGKTSLKLGVAVGLGCDFGNHWALAERFTSIDIDGTTLATLETSLSYRF
jgi:hypothetical protein